MHHKTNRKAITLVELIITSLILSVVMAMMIVFLRSFFGKQVVTASQKLSLQMEARRGLVSIFGVLQEGIEIMSPQPGQCLPYIVLRDYVNNLHFIFLKKSESVSERTKRDIFTLFSSIHDISANKTSAPKEILRNVERMTFTAHGYNGVLISAQLRDGSSSFSFVNFVRLKNALSDDSL
ncbi:MAG: prepilin-type N-terminal cleavage/methylation domain-containing protein [Candidatus Riflebacteria bacterium]|nr:prepilin-type N-terminal cleavage/methylation domain-containing protein [Candidatus Riflebacteria bacterium]